MKPHYSNSMSLSWREQFLQHQADAQKEKIAKELEEKYAPIRQEIEKKQKVESFAKMMLPYAIKHMAREETVTFKKVYGGLNQYTSMYVNRNGVEEQCSPLISKDNEFIRQNCSEIAESMKRLAPGIPLTARTVGLGLYYDTECVYSPSSTKWE